MALRDKFRERTQPYLEPGEQIHSTFMGQTGPTPYLAFLTWLFLFWAKFFIISVTDRRIIVLRAGAFVPSKPKELFMTLPLQPMQREKAMSGLWGTVYLGEEKVHVHKRFHKDVTAIDEWLRQVAAAGVGQIPQQPQPQATASQGGGQQATPAGWYPDPQGQAAQRYFDGTNWTEHTA